MRHQGKSSQSAAEQQRCAFVILQMKTFFNSGMFPATQHFFKYQRHRFASRTSSLTRDAQPGRCWHLLPAPGVTGAENIVTTNDTTHPAVFFIQCVHHHARDALDAFLFRLRQPATNRTVHVIHSKNSPPGCKLETLVAPSGVDGESLSW